MAQTNGSDGGGAWLYITQAYRYPYATLNPLWAGARHLDGLPTRVVILAPDPDREPAPTIRDGATQLLETLFQQAGNADPDFDVELVEDDPLSVADTQKTAIKLIREAREEGRGVAVDVTPGRTLPKMALFNACSRETPDHVFYLSVDDYEYRSEPYMNIPLALQELVDLRDSIIQGGGDDD